MRVGSYEILSELGRGGVGVVFRARSPGGDLVALKVCHQLRDDAVTRFAREIRLQRDLGDGFVPVLDSGLDSRGPFLVMPLLAQGTLRDRFAAGPMPLVAAVDLTRTLGRALGRAHERGIVHRDLKPENILFDAAGHPLIADLGLAKHYVSEAPDGRKSASISGTGFLRGTVGYMAPEQMLDAKSVGPEADVFALGAILYESLTGERAFPGETVLEILTCVERGEFRPVREKRPDAPEALAQVVTRALAADPARRFVSGEALARALDAPLERRAKLGPLPVGVLLLTLVVLVLAVVAALRQSTGGPRETPDALANALRRGMTRFEAKDYQGASAAFDAALGLDPRSVAAWIGRGRARGRAGDVKGALADLDHAHEIDPRSAPALAARGAARHLSGDGTGARADLDAAIAIDPQSGVAWGNRGGIRASAGDLEGALADLDHAVALDPRDSMAWTNRSYVHHRQHDFERALADARSAVDADATNPLAWANLSVCLYTRKLLDEAIDAASHSIALDPHNVGAFRNRAAARRDRKDYASALADFTRALELGPPDGHLLEGKATCRRLTGDVDGAIADCTRAIELEPRLAVAFWSRGVAKGAKGELDGAVEDLKASIALEPRDADAWLALGDTLAAKGVKGEATAAYQRVIDLDPADAAVMGKRIAALDGK